MTCAGLSLLPSSIHRSSSLTDRGTAVREHGTRHGAGLTRSWAHGGSPHSRQRHDLGHPCYCSELGRRKGRVSSNTASPQPAIPNTEHLRGVRKAAADTQTQRDALSNNEDQREEPHACTGPRPQLTPLLALLRLHTLVSRKNFKTHFFLSSSWGSPGTYTPNKILWWGGQ